MAKIAPTEESDRLFAELSPLIASDRMQRRIQKPDLHTIG